MGAQPPKGPQDRAFYGRRKGHRLRAGQASRLQRKLPELQLDLEAAPPGDLRKFFAAPVGEVHLEIGFGGGEHLVHEARSLPRTGFIGCEPFVNGVAKLVGAVEAEALANIRLHAGDARDVLDWLPPAAVSRIWLLYPDPWPKRRHRKRRFVSQANIDALARVLAAGGEFRFATDIAGYADWTLRHFARRADFEWTAERADDWRRPWPGWPGTRYEAKAVRQGRTPCYLTFRRL